jgi:hypothetical protein
MQQNAAFWNIQKAALSLVPRTGLEPVRGCPRQILSLLRLPIPPPRRTHQDVLYHLLSNESIAITNKYVLNHFK